MRVVAVMALDFPSLLRVGNSTLNNGKTKSDEAAPRLEDGVRGGAVFHGDAQAAGLLRKALIVVSVAGRGSPAG